MQDLKVLNARGFTAEIRGEGVHPIKVVVGVHGEEQWEAKEKEPHEPTPDGDGNDLACFFASEERNNHGKARSFKNDLPKEDSLSRMLPLSARYSGVPFALIAWR